MKKTIPGSPIIASGFWSLSRHINYMGEMAQEFTLALPGLSRSRERIFLSRWSRSSTRSTTWHSSFRASETIMAFASAL
ncbi:hypothetical protein BC830DRAFT_1113768 [Chytriomyces sp. MP71]|nr:hypothetical protein BC830DRAFT_1113768 [Chytriomyces sp. MP71]